MDSIRERLYLIADVINEERTRPIIDIVPDAATQVRFAEFLMLCSARKFDIDNKLSVFEKLDYMLDELYFMLEELEHMSQESNLLNDSCTHAIMSCGQTISNTRDEIKVYRKRLRQKVREHSK